MRRVEYLIRNDIKIVFICTWTENNNFKLTGLINLPKIKKKHI